MNRVLRWMIAVLPLLCSSVTASFTSPPRGHSPSPLHVRDRFLARKSDNVPVTIRGYTYMGFQNGQTAPDGLWAGGPAADTDFAYVIYQTRVLGFNAVRLPYIFHDVFDLPPKNILSQCSPSSLADLRNHTTDPGLRAPGVARKIMSPPNTPLPQPRNGQCNAYFPASSTLDRLLWTVQKVVSEGMYCLVDYHPMGGEQTSHNPAAFVAGWTRVWRAILALPNFESDLRGRVFLDVLNEPDSMGMAWSELGPLYLRTMDALDAFNPDATIFFIEGTGQTGYHTNWGNGFVTDKAILSQYGLSDPNPFFAALMNRPYLGRVVISPHVYGPSVSGLSVGWAGDALFTALTHSFGYLTQAGYCNSTTHCHRFPTIVGEFGSKFQDPRDLQHLDDFARWAWARDSGKDGKHQPLAGWFYWCFNPNSGDTGGLVDDTFSTYEWVKVRFLIRSMGLAPWWL